MSRTPGLIARSLREGKKIQIQIFFYTSFEFVLFFLRLFPLFSSNFYNYFSQSNSNKPINKLQKLIHLYSIGQVNQIASTSSPMCFSQSLYRSIFWRFHILIVLNSNHKVSAAANFAKQFWLQYVTVKWVCDQGVTMTWI